MAGNTTPEPDKIERRTAVRFPIGQVVHYKAFRRKTVELGSGKTINMSSNGILFTTEHRLTPGDHVEVAVDWPFLLDGQQRLRFVAFGRVVRSEADCAVVAIERYELRTQGANTMT